MRLLVVVLGAIALAELWLLNRVAASIGAGETVLLVILAAVVGLSLLRRAGVAVLADMQRRMQAGEVPGRQLTHGAVILLAGGLLVVPGFLTDIAGLLMFLPPVRDALHRRFVGWASSRVTVIAPGGPTRPGVDRGSRDQIIDVESWEEL